MAYHTITLKEGRSTSVRFWHPWIFSGAIADAGGAGHGAVVRVVDHEGVLLGVGTFSAMSSISVRVFHFGEKDIEIDHEWFAEMFRAKNIERGMMGFGPDSETTGYRMIMSESDGVPGVIIDRYQDVFVVQLSTAGADALRDEIIAALVEVFAPRAIVERSDMAVRKEEGLEDVVAVQYGELSDVVRFSEYGISFIADVLGGQKTGFFFDQKDLRKHIHALAKGRSVLNLFSYTGASAIAAMKGGAVSVHNVDSSDAALSGVHVLREMHGIDESVYTTENMDVFQYAGMQHNRQYGMVLIDPPALIKSERHVEEGKKAYHFLNRAALRLVEDGGIFVTSSCSHFLTEEDLSFILRRASVQAGVQLSVLAAVHQSSDHPRSVYFPESGYLKSFVCRVKRL